MENYSELTQLLKENNEIKEYIDRLKSLGFEGRGHFGKKEFLMIKNDSNSRYTFEGISDLIGADKLKSIVEQFEGLIAVELHRVKEANEKQLAAYSIVKSS